MPANSLDSAPVAPVRCCVNSQPIGEPSQAVDPMHASVWRAEFNGSVVISGLSARLPQSDNMDEFRDHLMNHDDMVTESSRSWTPELHGTPARSGKLKDLTKFDSMFFGISHKQAHRMDPQMRMLLEVTYEAIVDAGVDPSALRGSRTGVFIGASDSEAACAWSADAKTTSGLTLIGCQRGMFANRLSYFFDLRGPSFTVDTACSSSLLAMDLALTAIRTGQCDQAIVGGSNITIRLATSVQFTKLGMLSSKGMCQSFDESGDGYCRSEGIVAIMLQKSADARRVYATLVHSKNNCDGAKDGSQAITFPSGASQTRLMKEVYAECGIDPASVAYVEAHGTGTKAGDPQELGAITDVLCKGRTSPLLIGSTKSNMGHPEPASGLAALAKIIVAMEEKVIPANLHYSEPNADIPGLLESKLQVVSANTPWAGGLVAINSFGFGGANVHAVLDSHKKAKQVPSANDSECVVPRLLLYAGRTNSGLRSSLQRAATFACDAEFAALLNRTAYSTPKSQPYRGYAMVSSTSGGGQVVEIKKCSAEKRPVWYVFAGMGTQWNGMGRDLMQLPCFRESIMRSDAVLKPLGVELGSLIVNSSDATNDFGSTIHAFVGIAAIQVALVDTLRALNVEPDGIVGHSVGELGCAYADGSLTAKETVLAAYWRGKCIMDACLEPGAMAAVGLSWEEAKQRCPAGVVPACHNSLDTVTVSGPRDAVAAFVEQLKDEGVFAKEVQSNGVAFHSYYMASIASKLREALSKVIVPKERSGRWVSTSIPQSEWGGSLARMSSADYHVNNLVSPVLFQEGVRLIPDDAVVIEIAPHCLLQAILKRSVGKGCENIGLQKRDQKSNLEFFLSNLGKLYMAGCNPRIASLYPTVSFPVSSGTPRVSSLVDWDHTETFDVPGEKDFDLSSYQDRGQSDFKLSSTFELGPESSDLYLLDHKIDGRILFPAAGYLLLAWKALAAYKGKPYETMPVVFDDVTILNATLLSRDGSVTLDTALLPGTGAFEISHSGNPVATGKVMTPGADAEQVLLDTGCHDAAVLGAATASAAASDQTVTLTPNDIYKELRLHGYEYGPAFQGICSADLKGTTGQLAWTGNWVTYLDAMLQLTILSASGHAGLRLPTRIRSTRISPRVQEQKVLQSKVLAVVDSRIGLIEAGGVQIFGLHTTSAGHRKDLAQPHLESYTFIPFQHTLPTTDSDQQYACSCLQYARQLLAQQAGSGDVQAARANDAGCTAAGTVCQDGSLLAAFTAAADATGTGVESEALRAAMARVDPNNDLLLQRVTGSACLKPLLDLALENTVDGGLSSSRKPLAVVELQADRWRVYERAVPLLTSQPLVNVDYVAVCEPGSSVPEPAAHPGTVSFATWTASQPPADKLKWANLVVCRCASADECPGVVGSASSLLKDGGFLLLLAPTANHSVHALRAAPQPLSAGGQPWSSAEWTSYVEGHGYCSLAAVFDGYVDTAFLFRAPCDELTRPLPGLSTMLHIDGLGPSWVDELKQKFAELQTHSGPEARRRRLWLVATDSPFSGIVGLVNCLRQEPGGELVRCIFNGDLEGAAMSPSVLDAHYKALQHKDIVFNVFRNNEWGSFRHLPLDKGSNRTCTKYAYVNVTEKGGGLSHLRWIESPLKFYREGCDKELCTVSYSSLNFRDVMLATGKLPPDAIPGHMQLQDCLLGMEFSGYKSSGDRVMGLLAAKGLATLVDADPRFLWPVPDSWSLEEAATVPVVYATAYYALVVRAQIRAGQSVLIHSGSGGVGQAAIGVALQHGCEVFTSVGSADKRQFLMKLFPQLSERSFCNSRDASFEFDIKRRTAGKGVDVVLNSLAEDKLQASLRVLAPHGVFLEIGKYDLANNSALGMSLFLKNVTFHGILLDALFEEGSRDWTRVRDLVTQGIADGAVKPLPATVFDRDQVEDAFRYMAQGKHIGKVLVKVNDIDPKESRVDTKPVTAVPRLYCDPEKCYVITGGLGGFGLELAGWLIYRGCRKLVLTSRSGVSTGYQARCLARWRTVDNVKVLVSRCDVGTSGGAQQLVSEASALGPIGGIFHLAMVLKDGFLENLTTTDFEKVFAPKVSGACNLDQLMRGSLGRDLEYFVAFSSIVGGRGNAGQANYGFANTAMERICERRLRDGLPGVAVQWGAIGDVGVVVNTMGGNETVIGGTLPQRIASCLDSLDVLLMQRRAAVVSSFVRAAVEAAGGAGSAGAATQDVAVAIAHILGINDVSSLSEEASLGDLGLDSLMGVEVKQVLERDFSIVLPMKAIRALSLGKLREMSRPGVAAATDAPVELPPVIGTAPPAAVRLLRPAAASARLMPDKRIVPMNAAAATADGGGSSGRPIFFVHPIEGDVAGLQQVAATLGQPAYGIQCVSGTPLESIETLAAHYIQIIRDAGLSLSSACIVGYSFGAAVAFEMARQLEAAGAGGTASNVRLVLLDGSHAYVAAHTNRYKASFGPGSQQQQQAGLDSIRSSGAQVTAEAEVEATSAFLLQIADFDYHEVRTSLAAEQDFAGRLNVAAALLTPFGFSADDVRQAAESFLQKLVAADGYLPPAGAYQGNIVLIKSSSATPSEKLGFDYGLSQVSQGHVAIYTVEGDHKTFLQHLSAARVAHLIQDVSGSLNSH